MNFGKSIKRILLLLLLSSFFVLAVFAQEDLSESEELPKTALELNSELNNSKEKLEFSETHSQNELENVNNSNSNSEMSKIQLEAPAKLLNNQEILLDSLEKQWEDLNLRVQSLGILSSSLEKDNMQLKNMLSNSNKTIIDLKMNLENYKKALESNKEDVDYIIELFSEAYAEVQRLNEYVAAAKKRERNNEIMVNIMIPTATIPMIVTGGILMATNNDFGKPVLYTGIGLFVGCEIVYNGGHFLFKIW